MSIHNIPADGQTQAQSAAMFLGSKKGFKQFGKDFAWYPHTVVADFNLKTAGI